MAKTNGRRVNDPPGKPSRYYCHVTGPNKVLPKDLSESLVNLEKTLGIPLLVLIQGSGGNFGSVNELVYHRFLQSIAEFERDRPVAVLLHSPGGYAGAAYHLARFLQVQCGQYTAIVPAYAKSAATLFALGATDIFLGRFAELGPLDAQLDDADREQTVSALEVTQSLERLNSEAMQAVDAQMIFWSQRSGKRIETLLPIASKFVADMMRPLFEKIDTVHYTKMARILKVAQDYAERLLEQRMPHGEAQQVAQILTQAYAEHGFVIDAAELRRIGLSQCEVNDDIAVIIDPLVPSLQLLQNNYVGFLKQVDREKESPEQSKNSTDATGSGERDQSVQARSTNNVD